MDTASAMSVLIALAGSLVMLGAGMAVMALPTTGKSGLARSMRHRMPAAPREPAPAPDTRRAVPGSAAVIPDRAAVISDRAAVPDPNAPDTIAHEFFKDKRCAICGLAIAEQPLVNHPGALRGPDGATIEWSQLPADRLLVAVTTHEPVCWNCHVAEEFRRLYPEMVTDRSEHATTIH